MKPVTRIGLLGLIVGLVWGGQAWAQAKRVWVVRPDESKLCGKKPGIEIDIHQDDLVEADIRVLGAKKAKDGVKHCKKCGCTTGVLNAYQIALTHLKAAEEVGFKKAPEKMEFVSEKEKAVDDSAWARARSNIRKSFARLSKTFRRILNSISGETDCKEARDAYDEVLGKIRLRYNECTVDAHCRLLTYPENKCGQLLTLQKSAVTLTEQRVLQRLQVDCPKEVAFAPHCKWAPYTSSKCVQNQCVGVYKSTKSPAKPLTYYLKVVDRTSNLKKQVRVISKEERRLKKLKTRIKNIYSSVELTAGSMIPSCIPRNQEMYWKAHAWADVRAVKDVSAAWYLCIASDKPAKGFRKAGYAPVKWVPVMPTKKPKLPAIQKPAN